MDVGCCMDEWAGGWARMEPGLGWLGGWRDVDVVRSGCGVALRTVLRKSGANALNG